MIDCSPTEISAIKQVFRDEVHILLYHWHIKRAWEKHIKTYLTLIFYLEDYDFKLNDLKDTIDLADDLFNVYGLVPGRVQVFQAAFDDLRRISTQKWYNLTGSVACSKKELKERETKYNGNTFTYSYQQNKPYFRIFRSCSLCLTRLRNRTKLNRSKDKNPEDIKEKKYLRIRLISTICTNSENQSSKIPVALFGNGMFGKDCVKIKSNRCGAASTLWKELQNRDFLVARVD
ncbi:hypothetical protein BDF21DRAFT_404704 [Thamnidium elegans]|nr:hypothetical protein BDF21DRAFT_404704 [Thamnidium elegans]